MKIKHFFLTLASLFVCAAVHAQTETTVLIGTNSEFPPFSFREGDQIVGFDIDIAKAVAKRLGKEPQFKDMPFDALIPDLIMGNVDFVAAGMTYTEERAKRVAFTKPYLTDDALVILTMAEPKNGPIDNVDGLIGKTVVVNEGFTADQYLSSKPGINLVRLPATADAFMALITCRVDAFVSARSTVDKFIATQHPSKFKWTVIPGTADDCVLAIPKKYPQLLSEIQTALDDMEKDGTIAQIKTKWGL